MWRQSVEYQCLLLSGNITFKYLPYIVIYCFSLCLRQFVFVYSIYHITVFYKRFPTGNITSDVRTLIIHIFTTSFCQIHLWEKIICAVKQKRICYLFCSCGILLQILLAGCICQNSMVLMIIKKKSNNVELC